MLNDTRIYKVIKNGYPYKTPEQMGCANYKEAFTATKMCVYAMIYGFTLDDFESIGTDESDRTYNAIKNILEVVEKEGGNPLSSAITIIEETPNWKQDENNKNYIYKILKAQSEGIINRYNVYLGENFPEGTRISDVNNNFRESFSRDEAFKVSIPIKSMKSDGLVNIRVSGDVKTNPIYLGETLQEGTQDYAVTRIEMEKGEGYKDLKYSDNETKIRIIKKGEKGEKLRNAIFELLDENKKVIKSNLTTDVNGEILIKNLIPGRYYIKEKMPPDGYRKFEKFVEVKVNFNEELNVTVKNSKEEEPTVEIDRNFIEVSNIEEEEKQDKTEEPVEPEEPKEPVKLPKTGM